MSSSATCRLIVTADDFGYSVGRNRGVIEAYQRGIVCRTSLMVNGVQAADAVARAKQCGIPMGLHFNISEGRPISTASDVSTLVDNDGFFLDKQTLRKAVDRGEVDSGQVRNELKAQLAEYRRLVGDAPLYVDGHQHLHIVPDLAPTFASCLKEDNILETRIPIQMDIENHTWVGDWLRGFNIATAADAESVSKIFTKYGVKFPDYFFGLTTMGNDMTIARLSDAMRLIMTSQRESSASFTCELMSHPGFPTQLTEETRSGKNSIAGCGQGPDEFEMSQGRKHELDILTSPDLKQMFDNYDVTLTSSCSI